MRSRLAIPSLLFLSSCLGIQADPQSFGLSELQRALAEKHVPMAGITGAIRPGATLAEGFEISGHQIIANDARGLMYGYLEAGANSCCQPSDQCHIFSASFHAGHPLFHSQSRSRTELVLFPRLLARIFLDARKKPLQSLQPRFRASDRLSRSVLSILGRYSGIPKHPRRHRNMPQSVILRANIVLEAANGTANKVIARQLSTSLPTVLLWRRRYESKRLEGILQDQPRSGRPRRISDETIASIVDATMKTIPKDATHWSVRSMAKNQPR
jgi:hypothetical protein